MVDGDKLKQKKNSITEFSEKPKGDGAWVSGGFFVLNKNALNTLKEQYDMLRHNTNNRIGLMQSKINDLLKNDKCVDLYGEEAKSTKF